MRKRTFCLGILLVALAACGGKKTVRLPPPTPAVVGAVEEGIASWYGHPYHGRRTSSGEVYDMNQMTAAHLRLPFGTWVRVTNLSNGRKVDVRVTDRGPFVKNRVIDLSRASAREIRMLGPGTARVRLEVVATPSMAYRTERATEQQPARQPAEVIETMSLAPPQDTVGEDVPCDPARFFGVQVGWFRNYENAERLYQKMTEQYGEAEVFQRERGGDFFYQIVVGRESDSAGAELLLARLREDRVDGFITPVREGREGETPNCL